MARINKVGIDYFSHDVDMLQDRKIMLIKAKHGLLGYAVYLRLLEELYRDEGYFLAIDDDFNILFADTNNIEINVYKNILNDCIKYELFDNNLFNVYNILTSKRIQTNYCKATYRRKEIELIEEYLLLKTSEINDIFGSKIDNVNIYSINDDINSIDDSNKKQSKVKKSKVKKSKGYYHHQKDADSAPAVDVSPSQNILETDISDQGDSVSIFSFVEDQFARPLKKAECALLEFFLQEYPKELIQEAVSRAVLNQATNIKYVQSILVSWSNKGIKTLSEVHEEDKRFQKAKKSKLKKFNPKGKDAKLRDSKTSRASPDSDKIPDYYKIYAQRDKQINTGG